MNSSLVQTLICDTKAPCLARRARKKLHVHPPILARIISGREEAKYNTRSLLASGGKRTLTLTAIEAGREGERERERERESEIDLNCFGIVMVAKEIYKEVTEDLFIEQFTMGSVHFPILFGIP